jgi:branched-chain amino acid transport system permease protein
MSGSTATRTASPTPIVSSTSAAWSDDSDLPAAAGRRESRGRYGLVVVLVGIVGAIVVHDLSEYGSLVRLGNNVVAGVSNGSLWALVAIGYTLVYGIVELINFAHGEVFMIGSFVAVALYPSLGLDVGTAVPLLLAGLVTCLLVSALASGALNVMIERVGYRPLRDAPRLAPLITAVGFSFILQNVGLLWLGGSPQSVPDLIGSQTELFAVGGIAVTRGDAFAIAGAAPLIIAVGLFISRARMGKAMRACAQDPEAARLMGVNVDATISTAFLLGGLMAGAAGLFYALYQTTVWYFQGFNAGLIAFTAAVMGGIGNLKGAVLGGLLIGIIQQTSDNRVGSQWTPALVFSFLVLVIVFRPQGLLGKQTRREG